MLGTLFCWQRLRARDVFAGELVQQQMNQCSDPVWFLAHVWILFYLIVLYHAMICYADLYSTLFAFVSCLVECDIESFLFDERDKQPNFWKTESTPWHTLAAGDREEVRKSFLADESQSCLFSLQRSQHLVVVDFSGGFPRVGIYTLNWVVFQCLNPPTCDLVDGGLPTRGLTLRRWKNTRPFGPRCEPRATWWQFLVKVVQPNGGGARLGKKYRSCWKKKRQIALDMWGAVNLFEDQFSTDRAKMVQNVRAKVPKKT